MIQVFLLLPPTPFSSPSLLYVCLIDSKDNFQGVFQGCEKNKLKAMEKTESAEHNEVISFLHLCYFCYMLSIF